MNSPPAFHGPPQGARPASVSTSPLPEEARSRRVEDPGGGFVAWLAKNKFTVDTVAAGLLFSLFLVLGVASMVPESVYSAFMSLPLMWRRTRPALSSALIMCAALLHLLLGMVWVPADILIFVSLYSSTAYGRRWVGSAALGAAIFGSLLEGMVVIATTVNAGSIFHALFTYAFMEAFGLAAVVGIWGLGKFKRVSVLQLRYAEERAEQLEREREQQAALGAAGERARIAREMHDVVAHSLSIIIAQSDGGKYAAAASPHMALEALDNISATGRNALADMRRLLGVLREGDAARLGPQPALEEIDRLIGEVRKSGLDVRLDIEGAPRELPVALSLSAFRIVQESLTNVLKHAGPAAQASVKIVWEPARLSIAIDDNGRGAASADDGAGHGIDGMRERARLFKGTLTAAPTPVGGFRVHVSWPFDPAAPFKQPHSPHR